MKDSSKYHKYEVIGDLNRIEKYINNCKDTGLKKAIDAQVSKYYGGDYKNLVSYRGEIAPGFNSVGGGLQYELPLPVKWLEKLGILKEIG
ncbi:MAG: glycohydrolase toxin TNT-related protein [Sporolactobacillus sp.]